MEKDSISLNINYLVGLENIGKDAFGKLFGLNRGAIGTYIDGKAKPKIETLQKISEKYNILLDDLVNNKLSELTRKPLTESKVDTTKELSAEKLSIVIDAVLLHEEQLLSNRIFKQWLDLKLITRENTVLKEIKQKKEAN